MRVLLCGVLLATAFGLSRAADDKKVDVDAKKLLGKWEPKDKKDKTQIEFLKDGKLSVTSPGEKTQLGGTYKLDGVKLTITLKVMDKDYPVTLTVTKLTDTELVTKDEGGKEETLVRSKDK
jgi:uncharacterized protein (TIGR03066 family)